MPVPEGAVILEYLVDDVLAIAMSQDVPLSIGTAG